MDKDKPPLKADFLVSSMGDMKPWQFIVCMWVFLAKFGTGWHTLAHIFIAAPMKVTCVEPDNSTDKCSSNCTKREYDRSVFEETVESEFDMGCEPNMITMSQSLVMFGIMVGSLIFGVMSDRFGRRPAFLSCCFLQLICGPISTMAPAFWFYNIFRFLTAVATGGTMVTSFCVIMEVIGPKYRELISITYQLPFNSGHGSLALFSYYLRSWRLFYLAISLCSLMFIPYICVIPETPRWLFSNGKIDKAVDVLERAAKFNKLPTENIRSNVEEAYKTKISGTEIKKGTMIDLFRHSNLRKKTLTMAFDWLVVCLTYYGVAQYISGLSGNIFINVAVSAFMGVPGTLLCVPMTKYFGRKITFILSNSLSGFSLLAIACLPNIQGLPVTILASIGLFGSSVTFPNAYLYAGELFPTAVRNSGVGFCSLIGRVGSIVAPFVAETGKVGKWMPAFIFGMFSAAAALSILLLPETKGFQMPDTIEEGESFGKKVKQEG